MCHHNIPRDSAMPRDSQRQECCSGCEPPPLIAFYLSLSYFTYHFNQHKHAASKKINRKCPIFVSMCMRPVFTSRWHISCAVQVSCIYLHKTVPMGTCMCILMQVATWQIYLYCPLWPYSSFSVVHTYKHILWGICFSVPPLFDCSPLQSIWRGRTPG